jgi:hypothetical protein
LKIFGEFSKNTPKTKETTKMNFQKISLLSLSILLLLPLSHGYKPVVLFHGILSDAASMLPIAEQIQLVSFLLLSNLFSALIENYVVFNSDIREQKFTLSTSSITGRV